MKELFSSLVGSHNYNLNDENSDEDRKIFILPSFSDLYYNKTVSKSSTSPDREVKDIRLLINLLKKSNPGYLEVLFSTDLVVQDVAEDLVSFLLKHREEIVRANPNNLIGAILGVINQKRANLYKLTPTSNRVDSDKSYNSKNLHHIVRLCYLVEKYNFHDNFEQALWNDGEQRDYLLSVKNGVIPLCDVERVADEHIRRVEKKFKDNHFNSSDLSIFESIDNIIFDLIKRSVSEERK
ncbi:MAG: hypothetical protein E6R13_07870 [Spirochaetes bacterium]|nr:MAG: hypothetical protein E6R13_07870 [Spirochaetota bacterium]